MVHNPYPEYRFLLGSKSPRRQHLLKELGIQYELVTIDVDEVFPENLKGSEIPEFLCALKAEAFPLDRYASNTILITADTIVWLEGECIGKPAGKKEAVEMLGRLSGKKHEVYTAICLKGINRIKVFHVKTEVTFKRLTPEEIHFYIDHHRPYDKAGAYGIQDWIGFTSVTGIRGCYYNVMGFPVQRFWEELQIFIKPDWLGT